MQTTHSSRSQKSRLESAMNTEMSHKWCGTSINPFQHDEKICSCSKTFEHGDGGVMAWDYMAASGTGLTFIQGRVDSEVHRTSQPVSFAPGAPVSTQRYAD